MIDDVTHPSDEGRIRYRAARRGFRVMQTRGLEHDRREKAGAGTFMLLDETTNGVALFAATLGDIAAFLKANDQARRHHIH
jgi:hypothetical protein